MRRAQQHRALRQFLATWFGLALQPGDPFPANAADGNGLVYAYDNHDRLVCADCLNTAPPDVYDMDARRMVCTVDSYPESRFPPTSHYRVKSAWGVQCSSCERWLLPEVLACDDCGLKANDGAVRRYPDGLQMCGRCRPLPAAA
jgi:hypothetical protein